VRVFLLTLLLPFLFTSSLFSPTLSLSPLLSTLALRADWSCTTPGAKGRGQGCSVHVCGVHAHRQASESNAHHPGRWILLLLVSGQRPTDHRNLSQGRTAVPTLQDAGTWYARVGDWLCCKFRHTVGVLVTAHTNKPTYIHLLYRTSKAQQRTTTPCFVQMAPVFLSIFTSLQLSLGCFSSSG
jgi:hypothetical protein